MENLEPCGRRVRRSTFCVTCSFLCHSCLSAGVSSHRDRDSPSTKPDSCWRPPACRRRHLVVNKPVCCCRTSPPCSLLASQQLSPTSLSLRSGSSQKTCIAALVRVPSGVPSIHPISAQLPRREPDPRPPYEIHVAAVLWRSRATKATMAGRDSHTCAAVTQVLKPLLLSVGVFEPSIFLQMHEVSN